MTVYVVQRPTKKNKYGKYVSMFDITPAEEFGKIVTLLDPQDFPFQNPDGLLDTLWQKLENYDGENDFILCIGNPILIGWTIAVASCISPSSNVSCLQWNTKNKVYFPITAKIC